MKEKRTCSFCGSENYFAKGLCRNCYARARNNGTPEYKNRKAYGPGEKAQAIIDLFVQGVTQAEVARQRGVSRQYVNEVLKRYCPKSNAEKLREMSTGDLAGFMAAQTGEEATWWLDWLNRRDP